LVRFLFGLPFSLIFTAVAWALTPGAAPRFSLDFWISAVLGAVAQVMATAALLVAMRRAGFAVGTALQQSSLPLAALVGWIVYGDNLRPLGWAGVLMTSVGLGVLSWPPKAIPAKGASSPQPVSGAAFGLLSGLCFGFSLNAFRHATLSMDARHPIFAALACVAIVQAMQAVTLSLWLAARDPGALRAVATGWRQSLGAGLCGACASAGWFVALALSAAAPVRAVGVVEAPMAAIAGRRFFRERLHGRQLAAGGAVLAGVLLTTLA
jgi:drug/metabolite transporter (DMT)-like permease